MSKLKTDSNGFPSEIPFKINEVEERELGYTAIHAQISFLMGKVLTIIDASLPEGKQNKCVKDLIKDAFSSKLDWIYQLCGLPETNDTIGDGSEIIGDLSGNHIVSQEVTRK